MSYAESYNESGRRRSSSSTRGGRPFYISPHLRNNNNDDVSFIVTIPARPNPAWFSSGSSNRYNRYDRASPSYRPGYGYGRGRFGGQPRELDIEGSSSGYPFDEQEIPDDGGINFDAYEDIPVETIGQDVPPPVDSFSEFDFGKALGDNIQRCNYVRPTPIQRHAIPVVMAGRDLMACAQTGSGKTAAFCFPIISGILRDQSLRSFSREMTAYPLALILSPTRELCCQIHEEAKKFSYQTGVKVVVAYGGAPMYQQLRDLEKGVDILVATPGRLVDMIERERVSLSKIKYLALDEADRMLDMGFEPQIRQIVQRMGMPPPGSRQTMLFSATFPNDIKALASDFLSNYIFLSVGRVGSSTDLITQKVVYVYDTDKRNCLLNLLREQKAIGNHGKHALILVFVETKRGADALEHWLSTKGFPAAVIHGDKERENALKSFKTGRTPILVATDVAARGLDIPHVAHVINYDLPKSIDDYVHRIGRTGRAGKSGSATAFFSDKNALLAKSLADLMRESKQEVPSWLTNYAQQSSYPSGSSGGGSGGRGGGGGGGRYYGGGRYGGGGRDYQYENNYRGGNYNNNRSGQYGYSNAIPIYDAPSPPSYDYSASPRPDSNTVEFDEGWN